MESLASASIYLSNESITGPDNFQLTPHEITIIITIWKAISLAEHSKTSQLTGMKKLYKSSSLMNYLAITFNKLNNRTICSMLKLSNDTPFTHATDIDFESLNENYKILVFIQTLSIIIHCLDTNKKFPMEYLSKVSLINSRIYDLHEAKYNLVCHGLLISIVEIIADTVSQTHIDNYLENFQFVFSKFLSQFVQLLTELSEHPTLDPVTNEVIDEKMYVTTLANVITHSQSKSSIDSSNFSTRSSHLLLYQPEASIEALEDEYVPSSSKLRPNDRYSAYTEEDGATDSEKDVDFASADSTLTDNRTLESDSDSEAGKDFTGPDVVDNSFEFINIFDQSLDSKAKSMKKKPSISLNLSKNKLIPTNSLSRKLTRNGKKKEDCVVT